MISSLSYVRDKLNGDYRPSLYPSEERPSEWVLPDDIRSEYSKLNSMIETKYSREYLKICAFYNKLFPALRSGSYITSTYNTPPFTALDQERNDTGTGISSNYLKQIIDQVVSRIGTITFEPMLVADVPTLEYIVYKEEAERLLRKTVRDRKFVKVCMEVFHDAAIVGFSHIFIDPVTHQWVKANDYEIGMFESQFTADDVKQALYRNYRFPVTSLPPYLANCSDELKTEIVNDVEGRDWVDFKLYFDCPGQRAVITIGGKTLPDIPYPFDRVQMVTFGWDNGFSRVTSTSLFDLLYPNQREMNKVNAKIQQLIRLYKGAVPIFSNDVDLAMKSITNGAGECLYVNSARPVDSLVHVLNPTPLDAQLNATKTEIKTEMYELAGLQQMTFDMENIRSAATMVAIDQTRDTVFQSQMGGMATFVSDKFRIEVNYNATITGEDMWQALNQLLKDARTDMKPVMVADPLGNKGASQAEPPPDYAAIGTAKAVLDVLKGNVTYETLPYMVNKTAAKTMAAMTALRMDALNVGVPDTLEQFLIAAFIDDVKRGAVSI